MNIVSVVGARPNFIKIAPLCRAFADKPDINFKVVHTGQHFDASMSDIFFSQLELPAPDYFLGVGSGSHSEQTARVMLGFEPVLQKENPDLVLVIGDVNSTLACALVAAKANVPIAHVEAGLRSYDRTMPEEINRIVTDAISDELFVSEMSGLENLKREGISPERIHMVGNVMIDSLTYYQNKASELNFNRQFCPDGNHYALVTMHRPANVDTADGLRRLWELMQGLSRKCKVLFPIHPRTLNRIQTYGLLRQWESLSNLMLMEPVGYLQFLSLMLKASLIVTDSGGIQEESTFLKVPCITLRNSTERPVTVELGTNHLVAWENCGIFEGLVDSLLSGGCKKGEIPPLWDGKTSERIRDVIVDNFYSNAG